MELTDHNFEQEVEKSDKPVMVEFWGSWCPPCKMMAPILEELNNEYEGSVKIKKINMDLHPGSAEKFRIMGVPTFILFKEGKEIKRLVAAQTKDKLKEFVSVALK